jgi:methylated-DNA-[protein]-cysteine S-methyltransferase
MKMLAYCLFDTSLGAIGIGWRDGQDSDIPPAVVFLQLPEATRKMTESRIARIPGVSKVTSPPPQITELIQRISKHLRGETQDFRDVPIDLDEVAPFERQVYEAAREIPAGQTKTYGEIAKALNQPHAAQAVGQALGRNPVALLIPCHRVLAAGGKFGGFSAPGGRITKTKLLVIEGAAVEPYLFSSSA